jgi:hypothetical protein
VARAISRARADVGGGAGSETGGEVLGPARRARQVLVAHAEKPGDHVHREAQGKVAEVCRRARRCELAGEPPRGGAGAVHYPARIETIERRRDGGLQQRMRWTVVHADEPSEHVAGR